MLTVYFYNKNINDFYYFANWLKRTKLLGQAIFFSANFVTKNKLNFEVKKEKYKK